MTLEELYSSIGGNYQEAKGRLMSDRLVEKFSMKFLDDDSYANLKSAVEAGSIEESFRAAHTLKGVSANLAFSELQQAASNLTEQLRPQTDPADEALLAAVDAAYDKVIAGLKAYQA